jgi:hypothetical protein
MAPRMPWVTTECIQVRGSPLRCSLSLSLYYFYWRLNGKNQGFGKILPTMNNNEKRWTSEQVTKSCRTNAQGELECKTTRRRYEHCPGKQPRLVEEIVDASSEQMPRSSSSHEQSSPSHEQPSPPFDSLFDSAFDSFDDFFGETQASHFFDMFFDGFGDGARSGDAGAGMFGSARHRQVDPFEACRRLRRMEQSLHQQLACEQSYEAAERRRQAIDLVGNHNMIEI